MTPDHTPPCPLARQAAHILAPERRARPRGLPLLLSLGPWLALAALLTLRELLR